MGSSKWGAYVQALTNLALLAGLILVVVQINQTQHLERVKHGAQWTQNNMQYGLAAMGEQFNEALERAVFEPDQLSNSDQIALNFAMEYKWSQYARVSYLVFHEIMDGEMFLGAVRRDVGRYITISPFTRVWWSQRLEEVSEGRLTPWQKVVLDELQNANATPLSERLEAVTKTSRS